MVLQPDTVQYDKYNAVSYSITEYNIIHHYNTIVVQYNSYKYHTVQYSFGQYSIEHYQTKIVGKNNNNSKSINPNSKTNIITDGVMNFLGAIVDINKTLEKAQERLPDIKTLLRSFF